ncbi:MAG: hypothetical protein ACYCYM_08215 [Saccharofermentanales bacterium]
MNRRISKKHKAQARRIEQAVQRAIGDAFATMLHDITYRMNSLLDISANSGRLNASQLNLSHHMIDGYVVTNNSPSAGSVAWTDLNVVYKGVTYALTNGNTNLKYLYWTMATTPSTVKTSATKPTLGADDILLFINEGGVAVKAVSSMQSGAILLDGTINSNEIATNAIVAAKIFDGSVTSGKIGSGAVIAGKLATDAVASANIASGAVISGKLGTDAVGSANIASSAVTAVKIADATITGGKIANTTITSNQIADATITGSKIANTTITAAQIADTTITSGKIADSAIIESKIGAGAVATDKLNIATHFIF